MGGGGGSGGTSCCPPPLIPAYLLIRPGILESTDSDDPRGCEAEGTMERDSGGRGGGVYAVELTDRLELVGLQRVGRGGGRLSCHVAASCTFDNGPSE